MKRRPFNCSLVASAAVAILPSFARGQSTNPVRILVGFAPGGSADTLARVLAEQMQRTLGRTMIVENRTGAGGRLAPEQVKRAAPNGDTLMVVPHGPMALFPHIYKNLSFDPTKDFSPIARLVGFDYALIAANTVPARNTEELKRWIGSSAANANYASPGAGTIPHFIGVSVAQALGVPMSHVSYRGAALAVNDVVAGMVPFAYAPLADATEMAAAGRLKIIATSGSKRSSVLTGVPTLKEMGIDFEQGGWYALYGPAGLPSSVVETLHQAASAAVSARALKERWTRLAFEAAPSTPAELAHLQQRESAYWAKAVAASGFTPQE